MFKVVFLTFSKPTGKYLFKSLCVGVAFRCDKVAPKIFTLAFFKLFQAVTLQKRTLARVPVTFEKVLRFLAEHPKTNTFVPFRSS